MQIELKNLVKNYTSADGLSKVTAVNDISLEIPSNTIFGIIGKSGAGKSSLVRLISMMEKPDSGEVYYDGQRVDNLDEKELVLKRRRIGMIFQNFNLFSSRSAGENIAYPMEICGVPKEKINERVDELLEIVELSDRKNARISTLSGGQKQRIAIARALSTNPDILFCDEATSALDPQTTRSILALIRDIQKKMKLTVVMITHQMEVVRDACEYVAVVENGKIVEQAAVDEIFANPKTETTKDFLKNISRDETQSDSQRNVVCWTTGKGEYELFFIGEATGKPVLSYVCRNCNVDFNIYAAGIQYLAEVEKNVGTMLVDITGNDAEIEKAIEMLNKENVKAQKIR